MDIHNCIMGKYGWAIMDILNCIMGNYDWDNVHARVCMLPPTAIVGPANDG